MPGPEHTSVRDVDERLTAPGGPFELEVVEVDGRQVRTWKHAPRTLGEALEQGRELGGDRDFLVLGDERLSHARHFDQVQRIAAALSDAGVGKGDRVAIAMRNLPEWSVTFFAALQIGAIAAPLNAFWNGAELAFAVEDCDPKVLVVDGERLERLAGHEEVLQGRTVVGTRLDDRKTTEPLPGPVVPWASWVEQERTPPAVDVAPDDLATIFYTSGTTSHPKGVLGTHRNLCASLYGLRFVAARGLARAGVEAPAAAPPAVVLLPVPLFHASGCHSNLVNQAWSGGTIVLMRRWDPELALDLVERERVTVFSGVPTMNWDLVNSPTVHDRDLSSLRAVGGGGAATPPELLRRVQEVLPGRAGGTGYGMTESSSLTTSIGGADYVARPSSVGVPLPIVDIRIVDEEGQDVAPGEVGEIWIQGPTVVTGYWKRPEDTERTFGDGWLRSGDLGRIDGDGFLFIVDRAKDMVIRGGENISSLEVEAALFEHRAVLEAAVVAVPHDVLGEEVGAVVRLRDGADASVEELRAHAAERLAPFKVPAHIWLHAEPFPRGATGKIQKRELRAAYT